MSEPPVELVSDEGVVEGGVDDEGVVDVELAVIVDVVLLVVLVVCDTVVVWVVVAAGCVVVEGGVDGVDVVSPVLDPLDGFEVVDEVFTETFFAAIVGGV